MFLNNKNYYNNDQGDNAEPNNRPVSTTHIKNAPSPRKFSANHDFKKNFQLFKKIFNNHNIGVGVKHRINNNSELIILREVKNSSSKMQVFKNKEKEKEIHQILLIGLTTTKL